MLTKQLFPTIRFLVVVFSLVFLFSQKTKAQTAATTTAPDLANLVQQVGAPGDGVWAVTEAGPHHNRWAKTSLIQDGDSLRQVTDAFVELANGLNRKDDNGNWVRSDASFEIAPNGVAVTASKTAHKIVLTSPTDELPVDVLMPDGQRLSSRVLGISYYSPTTGQSVMIAEIKPSQGKLIPSNEVLYEDCFDGGFRADLRYRLSLSGFEQDLIFVEQPPSPEDVGINDLNARLEVITEFINAQQPAIQEAFLTQEQDSALRGGMVEPDFVDQTLWFGEALIGHGMAIDSGDGTPDPALAISTGKRWRVIDGRNILFEAIPFKQAAQFLSALPAHVQAGTKWHKGWNIASARSELIPKRKIQPQRKPILVAENKRNSKGFVLDYTIISGTYSNYTFYGDTTYYATNQVNLSGTTILEGGTVVKFARDNYPTFRVWLMTYGPITCITDNYRPIVLTGRDDDTVGMVLSDSIGTPSGIYAAYNLYANSTGAIALENIRSRFGWVGLCIASQAGHTIRDCQIVNCTYGVIGSGSTVGPYPSIAIRNGIIDKPSFTAFAVWQSSITGEHLSLHNAGQVYYIGDTNSSSLALTNSIIAGYTNSGSPYTVAYCSSNTSDSGYFQSAAAGNLYLANETYRNQGTTNIEARLLASLKQKTTYPPIKLTTGIAGVTTLGPVVQRDVDTPDLGYHYPPLDYVLGGILVTNGTLILTNGVAIGTYGTRGILISKGSSFVSEGTSTRPNHLGHINRVQEQPSFVSGGSDYDWLAVNNSGTANIDIHLRSSDLSLLSGSSTMMNLIGNVSWLSPAALELLNSYVRGTYQDFYSISNAVITVAITNSLLERDTWNFTQDCAGSYPISVFEYNNLFRSGSHSYYHNCATLNWTIHDNLFDATALNSQGYTMDSAHNAYRAGLPMLNGETGPKTNLFIDYIAGPMTNYVGYLGSFYYPTNGTNLATLIDAGSRYATAAGLYHYTTTLNQVKDGSSIVDIGYHFIALDGSGNPADADSDAIPDYVEDRNGNGSVDLGETDWQTSNSNVSGATTLVVFTILK